MNLKQTIRRRIFVSTFAKAFCLSAGLLAGLSAQSFAADTQTAASEEKPFEWGKGTKVLLVGGGSSHDFSKWFNEADVAILKESGITSIHYTDKSSVATRELASADVVVLSTN